MLYLTNTLTGKKEEFKPIHKGEASMYNCGPTVYYYAHIGNLRAYVFADILRRALEYLGYKVKQIINVTDFYLYNLNINLVAMCILLLVNTEDKKKKRMYSANIITTCIFNRFMFST